MCAAFDGAAEVRAARVEKRFQVSRDGLLVAREVIDCGVGEVERCAGSVVEQPVQQGRHDRVARTRKHCVSIGCQKINRHDIKNAITSHGGNAALPIFSLLRRVQDRLMEARAAIRKHRRIT